LIRQATLSDITRMVEMGRANYQAVGGGAEYDPEAAARFLHHVILPNGAAFLSGGGMIGGVLCPRWHAPTITEAVKMMWFSSDGSGFRLLGRFCEWARSMRAHPVITTAQDIPAAVLSRYGLARAETMLRGV